MTTPTLDLARKGFAGLAVDDAKKASALTNLERWLNEERFAAYQPTIRGLIERGAWNLLLNSFFQTMPFGTGGRRGPVGVGPNTINPYTLATSVQGHVAFLRQKFGADAALEVVIACDVRIFKDMRGLYLGLPNPLMGLTSRDFARAAACVYAANGVHVRMADPSGDWLLSTPELSFAIRHHGAHGGLNVSASHNHPDDNGGKFYEQRGGQEVPPNDEIFSALVEGIDDARTMDWDEARAAGLITLLDRSVHHAYIDLNVGLSLVPDARNALVVFTNLMGTGDTNVGDTLERAGFDLRYVESQRPHDGQFPHVPFRIANPEVPESMVEATDLARALGGDLVLATDPDGDRIGLVTRRQDGGYTFMNGNEIGALVTEHRFSRLASQGRLPARPLFVTTEVTSRLPVAIARHYGADVVSNLLVGCKYISNVLRHLEDDGEYEGFEGGIESYVIGLEESHGVMVSPAIRDKDAAGAAILLAERAAEEKARGRTLFDVLTDIYRTVGVHVTRQVSIVIEGAVGMARIGKIQDGLRALDPGDTVGGLTIESKQDFLDEARFGTFKSGTDRSARNFLSFGLEGGVRALVRPSGTEPKIKLYTEAIGAPLGSGATDDQVEAERARLDAVLAEVTDRLAQEAYRFLGVEMPRFALRVSSLLALEHREDFAARFVSELGAQATALPSGDALRDWAEERLARYGKDPRKLVAPAVRAWLEQEAELDGAAMARVYEAFSG
jgi:phosphoglucomutase/phosphomannomutase